MILTCDQMRRSEERLFASGVAVEPVMEKAGRGLAEAVGRAVLGPGRLVAFVGKGHNGGDALVAARVLAEWGWETEVRLVAVREELAELTTKKLAEYEVARENLSPRRTGGRFAVQSLVLVDGLLGIGATGALRGGYAAAASEMNRLRREEGGITVAVDIPSGVNGDDGSVAEGAVLADVTVTMAQVKAGLVADGAINHVGRIVVVPLDEIEPVAGDEGVLLLQARELRRALPRRDFDWHKGRAGRVGIVAGSRGLTGAAVMSSAGAQRAGAGLVTVYAHESIYPIVASAAYPEVMVKPVADYRMVLEDTLDAVAVGPGLGMDRAEEVLEIIANDVRPMVVDADALNMVSMAGADDFLKKCRGPRLLTPHPGEMARLWPAMPAGMGRREAAQQFAERNGITLLWKGARTMIAEEGRPTAYNSTGHPGMASGGMGDILTGIAGAWLGQGLNPYDAGCVGSWLLGRGAEQASKPMGIADQVVTATEVIEYLGRATADLKRGG
jgi:hydroxyethylthiazole kinase-like uncharacterized protein yjeF